METKMISSDLKVKPDRNTQIQPVTMALAANCRGVSESGGYINRPLMFDAWSQTTSSDFSILIAIESEDVHSQREKELEKKITALQENIKAHVELLSQIHATSARTSALLGQVQSQTQQFITNVDSNNTVNGPTQLSPKIVNAMNSNQQVNYSSLESVKYTIIADGTGNHNDEPIEIQLAEDDGALNLNSSADSERLEIGLAPEENSEIKPEDNTANNTMTPQHQDLAPTTNSTLSDHHLFKKRKLAVKEELSTTNIKCTNNQSVTPTNSTLSDHHLFKKRKLAVKEELSTTNVKCSNNQSIMPCDKVQQMTPNQNRCGSGNSLLKAPKTENKYSITLNNEITSNQNILPSQANYNLIHENIKSNTCNVSIDIENVMVSIGPNNTRVPAKVYDNINWNSASIATRKLLMAIFDRKVLATHSMTGKPSPAFKDQGKPIKQMLNPLVISDIIFAVTRKCSVSDKEVRNAITTKCADENKMMKLRLNKRTPNKEQNKENLISSFNNG